MIKLGELQAIEEAMTPGEWLLAHMDRDEEVYVIDERDNNIANTLESALPTADAAGICAARNALPVLIEIARAALQIAAAVAVFGKTTNLTEIDAACHAERRAKNDLKAALAKVSL